MKQTHRHFFAAAMPALFAAAALAQTGNLAPVVSKPVSRTIELPGEFLAYQKVALNARVPGYVEKVLVDRGSMVKQGEMLAELSAPELEAQIAEAESKVQASESDRLQAEAQLAGAESTFERLKKASQTPGAIAGNELVLAEKQVDAAKALVRSREQASRAAESAVKAQKLMQSYLKITAPFAGVVTERFVHPGALVGPGSSSPMLEIQQISRLRLVVAVPEEYVGGLVRGARVPFSVPSQPQRAYNGTVARVSHTLDPKTRAMAVELEVANGDGTLSPGMYPTVKWPVRRSRPALYVPKTAVVTTTERTFVIRNRGGRAEWVDVKKGPAEGDLIEVMGNLQAGDQVVRRGTDELHDGAAIQAKAQ
jgi:membrane fusion protein, multidrug efflux system